MTPRIPTRQRAATERWSAANQADAASGLGRLGLDTAGSRVAIVGLGATGLSAARFLVDYAIPCIVVDSRSQPPGLDALRACLPDVPVFLGGFRDEAFVDTSHLLVSPGVSLAQPEIARQRQAGRAIISDIDLFAGAARAPVAAVTGSNGKSTVTTLVGCMAEQAGRRVGVGGNLGTPVLDLLRDDADCYVLELSSFQLERSALLEPAAAVVLNVTPDHMDRYPSIEAYAAAKQRVFNGGGTMVLNADDPVVAAMAVSGRTCVRYGLSAAAALEYSVGIRAGEEWLIGNGRPVMRCADLRLDGRHNVSNALAALALGQALGLPLAAMCAALRSFEGLPHRMQLVAERDGIRWINDSKATNIGACRAALEGVDRPVVLIAGGDAKGADFSGLEAIIVQKAHAAVLIGRDADLFQRMLDGVIPTVRVDSMQQAVEQARVLARRGDCVLLSPACASLDQYTDYRARGRAFVEAVEELVS